MLRLTRKQEKVLEFLRERVRLLGSAPTYREIADHFGFKSPKAATDHVTALEKKGYVRRHGGRSRSIKLILPEGPPDESTINVPLLGRIQAGRAWHEAEEFHGSLDIDRRLLGRSANHKLFLLQIAGDSMNGCGIYDGDVVVADADITARQGDVVVGLIDGNSAVKTLSVKGGAYFLKSENPEYPDLIPIGDMRVQGVVITVLRRMN